MVEYHKSLPGIPLGVQRVRVALNPPNGGPLAVLLSFLYLYVNKGYPFSSTDT